MIFPPFAIPNRFRPIGGVESPPAEADDLRIVWLGTAGYAIRYRDHTLLLDPFVSRPGFTPLFVSSTLMSIGLFVAFAFVVPFAKDDGIGATAASRLIAVIGLSSIVGHLRRPCRQHLRRPCHRFHAPCHRCHSLCRRSQPPHRFPSG